MRVKVRLNLQNSLSKGTSIIEEDGSRRWLAFKYERLQNFCFKCGVIGHVRDDCSKPENTSAAHQQFGDWLKAASDLPHPFLTSNDSKATSGTMVATASRRPDEEDTSTTPELTVQQPVIVGDNSGEMENMMVTNTLPTETGLYVNSGIFNYKLGANFEQLNTRNATQSTVVNLIGGPSLTLPHYNCPLKSMGRDKQMVVTLQGTGLTEGIQSPEHDLCINQHMDDDPLLASCVFSSKGKPRRPYGHRHKSRKYYVSCKGGKRKEAEVTISEKCLFAVGNNLLTENTTRLLQRRKRSSVRVEEFTEEEKDAHAMEINISAESGTSHSRREP